MRLNYFVIALVTSGFCLIAAGAPLLTYSVSLAIFGLPHVLTELRYVDERFGARLSTRMCHGLLLFLGAIVVLRIATLFGLAPNQAPRLELLFVFALVATALPILRIRPRNLIVGVTVMMLIGCGLWQAPLLSLLILAVAHNLTPIGFLAEQYRGKDRIIVMSICGLTFGLVPIFIALGLPRAILSSIGLAGQDLSYFGIGALHDHLGVFIPRAWQNSIHAPPIFAAVAYLQCLHYAVVIHVLPKLQPDRPAVMRFVWPSRPMFLAATLAATGIFLVGFHYSFAETRAVYGVLAAVHAWLEIPILLMALNPSAASPTTLAGKAARAV